MSTCVSVSQPQSGHFKTLNTLNSIDKSINKVPSLTVLSIFFDISRSASVFLPIFFAEGPGPLLCEGSNHANLEGKHVARTLLGGI